MPLWAPALGRRVDVMKHIKPSPPTLLTLLLISLSVIASPPIHPVTDVKFDVSKARCPHKTAHGKASSDIRIALRFSGREVTEAKAIQTIVTTATDDAGKPLKNAALTAAGVEITLQKPNGASTGSGKINGVAYKQYDLSYQIKDPNNRVVAVEHLDANGTKLKSLHSSTSEGRNMKTKTLQFDTVPPPEATAKIYLITDKSLVTAPFDFKDIALHAT